MCTTMQNFVKIGQDGGSSPSLICGTHSGTTREEYLGVFITMQKLAGNAVGNMQKNKKCLLWRHCDTLCTSSYVDDVVFSHNGASCVFLSGNTTATIPTKFCSTKER